MMRRTGNSGFTFVEIPTVLRAIPVLVTIAGSRYQPSYEKALVATTISALCNIATAQELYHRLHLADAHAIYLLEISPSPKSEINIDQATARAWAGRAQIERTSGGREICIGDAVSPPGIASTSERVS
ncbi:MAG: hypothetical protein PVI01_05330 [Gemmatimonadales bacterium]|jgi:Tfp pilus assembly protein PilE